MGLLYCTELVEMEELPMPW